MRIGFVGLGAMGAPMTRRLAAAFPGAVLGCDLDGALAARVCAEAGAEVAGSLAEIAGACDVLLSCLPNNDVLRAVYLGPEGVAAAIRAGSITIDCSTVGPDATRDVYAGLQARGASHLDASMLGSVKQAEECTISFVVGGDEEAFARAKPILAACGQLIRHCGPSGAGNHMKLIHQTLVAGHAVAVAEAMGLCLETGADIEAFFDIVTQGTGFAYSRYFENRVPRMRAGDFSPLFMLKFMLKDARLARAMAPDPASYPALQAVIATLEEAEAAGFGDADFSAAMRAVEGRIGKTIHG
ncbi:MAG TPA: NAD(P)-dependent oxidoreductase [Kiloniellaceae bacterium]|nr:NAD(P)-dependent oxidoreductase [Kiloniellaceae bacterium]